MTVLSKFFAERLGFKLLTTNCYETTHTWHHDCNAAVVHAIPDALIFAFRTYGIFYGLSELAHAKGDPRRIRWTKLLSGVTQSSLYIAMNLVMYLWYMCTIRKMLGFYIWPTLGLSNGILCSFTAILVEKPARRAALALYLTNLASETLFRQAVNHGYLSYIPNGQWIILSAGLALYYFLRAEGRIKQPGLFEKIQGIEEHSVLPEWLWKRLPTSVREFFVDLRKTPKTEGCNHEYGCASTALEPTLRNFVLGFGVSSLLTLLRNWGNIKGSPIKLISSILGRDNLRIPTFMTLMPFLYNTVNCGLQRWIPGKEWEKTRNTVSGLASGVAMRAFPNVTIAMWVLWKGIAHLYEDLVDRGVLPRVPHGAIILYTLSTGYVLFVAAMEPHSLRSGYNKFLMGLSGGRMGLFNRPLYDDFGFDSSRSDPYFQPTLDTRFVTRNPYLR